MAERILLGKSVSTGLGHSTGSPKFGLWVTKSGITTDVTADAITPDDLGFNSELYDPTTGVTTKHGMGFGVKYKGNYNVSTSNIGSGDTYITWPEADFTKDSVVYAPLCFVQIGKTAGSSPSTQYSNTFYIDSVSSPNRNKGFLATVYPKNRDAAGAYSASGTYGALKILILLLDTNSSYRVYYAICHPGIDN